METQGTCRVERHTGGGVVSMKIVAECSCTKPGKEIQIKADLSNLSVCERCGGIYTARKIIKSAEDVADYTKD